MYHRIRRIFHFTVADAARRHGWFGAAMGRWGMVFGALR
jgi:hypothetical protein